MHNLGYSWRRARFARRQSVSSDSARAFVGRVSDLYDKLEAEGLLGRLINFDETRWLFAPDGLSTWAVEGAPEVKIITDGNPKDSFTLGATVAADGTKLDLFYIAKGKSDRVETFGPIRGGLSTHTLNGWSTTASGLEYLTWLREEVFPDDEPIYLVLDAYAANAAMRSRSSRARGTSNSSSSRPAVPTCFSLLTAVSSVR